MPEKDPYHFDQKNYFSILESNVNAIKSVSSIVETTIGPKGLDTMMVDEDGNSLVTNAGAAILSKMKIDHPVARMMVKVARAQQEKVGDGTTTATLLTAALVEEGAKQILRGVPTQKVVAGIEQGIGFAIKKITERSYAIQGLEDEWLNRIALTASRGNEDLTLSVIDASQMIGLEKLLDKRFRLADCVVAHPQADSIVFMGIFVQQSRMNPQMPTYKKDVSVLLLADSLVPELLAEEALSTEAGISKQEQLMDEFAAICKKIVELNVGLVVTTGAVHRLAEEILTDADVIVVSNVDERSLVRVAEHTGARPIKRNGLRKTTTDLQAILGSCEEVEDDELLNWIRISGGKGKEVATILVGAATEEVVEERERICKDTASAVQAAAREGFVPGGGAIELAVACELEQYVHKIQGLERYGIAVVAEALHRPIYHVIANAGFNPLEKVEEIKRNQKKTRSFSLGLNCENGVVSDMIDLGVVDPLLIKCNALQTAAEVSATILRIHNMVSMQPANYSEMS